MKYFLLLSCCLTTLFTWGQTKVFPIIKSTGPVFEVPYAADRPDPLLDYKIVATMGDKNEKSDEIHPLLSHFTRMYNLHAYGGVPQEKLNFVLIIYAGASPIVLNNETYRAKYKVDNPNLVVLEELKEAGVKILVCSQSLELLKLDYKTISPNVTAALSRFTSFTTYQTKGFVPIVL